MATDRAILKNQQVGALTTAPDIVTPKTAIAQAHTRSRDFTKIGTENAATNVASTVMFTVKRASKTASVSFLSDTTTAADNTDYVVITVKKQTAGASATTIATWNTHGGAQGAITANVPATFSVVANSDSSLAANDSLHYLVTKQTGTGKLVGAGTFTVDLEEI